MIGASNFEKPCGSPRLRSVMRVDGSDTADHVYVVSIGNGPCAVRITSRACGSSSTSSYVYASTAFTNTSTPPTKSELAYGRSTDSAVGTPSTMLNAPSGVSIRAGTPTAANTQPALRQKTTVILEQTYTLANGVDIPKLGLGTWFIDDDGTAEAVRQATTIGYRHVDTAQAYGNEAGVGEGIRTCGVPRDEMFVTSKLAAEAKSYDQASAAIDESLTRTGLEHLDLLIIHSPQPWDAFGQARRPR